MAQGARTSSNSTSDRLMAKKYSHALCDRLCASLAQGKSLRQAAQEEGVAASTVLEWAGRYKQFGEQYTRAREIGYALLAEEIIEISDDAAHDTQVVGEREVVNTEFVARSRLRVDSRKWILAKMLPKVYGEKLDLHHSGQIDLAGRLSSARDRTKR
jgi:hypothetical protein